MRRIDSGPTSELARSSREPGGCCCATRKISLARRIGSGAENSLGRTESSSSLEGNHTIPGRFRTGGIEEISHPAPAGA
jgi:hypothetical protein